MRADRLLSIMMILQARGRVTAKALATELEVSERTIYRDMDALSGAGVPIYSETGPNGGYALLDHFRTNLNGLTEGEVRALFMLSIPAPLADLGVSRELRAALLKLSAALPAARRQDESWVRQRFHLDATGWQPAEAQVPHLSTIHQAVWTDRRLTVVYRPIPPITIERVVDPYGLVAKAGVWYLVCARQGVLQVFQVAELVNVRMVEEGFTRPAGFDLAAFWAEWCAEYAELRRQFTAVVRVAPGFIGELPRYFGSAGQREVAPAGDQGWVTLELSFPSFAAARERLLGFGGGVEVLEPQALRRSIQDFAAQIVALYP